MRLLFAFLTWVVATLSAVPALSAEEINQISVIIVKTVLVGYTPRGGLTAVVIVMVTAQIH